MAKFRDGPTDLVYHKHSVLSTERVRVACISVFCTNTFYALCTVFHIAFSEFLCYLIVRKGDTDEKVKKDSNITFLSAWSFKAVRQKLSTQIIRITNLKASNEITDQVLITCIINRRYGNMQHLDSGAREVEIRVFSDNLLREMFRLIESCSLYERIWKFWKYSMTRNGFRQWVIVWFCRKRG